MVRPPVLYHLSFSDPRFVGTATRPHFRQRIEGNWPFLDACFDTTQRAPPFFSFQLQPLSSSVISTHPPVPFEGFLSEPYNFLNPRTFPTLLVCPPTFIAQTRESHHRHFSAARTQDEGALLPTTPPPPFPCSNETRRGLRVHHHPFNTATPPSPEGDMIQRRGAFAHH